MVTEAEARRLRPFMSGVVALAVALVAAIGWYYLGRPDESAQPVRTVDWKPFVKAGRAEGTLLLFAPEDLPIGWRATSVTFNGGNFAQWHLGMLDTSDEYVGIDENRGQVKDLVTEVIDENATQGADVVIAGTTWQTWTDEGGDYGVSRQIPASSGSQEYGAEAVLVSGTAEPAEIRKFVATLSTRPLS